MKDTYIYPAVFYYDEDGISIDFPDLPGCCPCADTTEEAVKNAREALGVHLCGMELDNDEIPEPSKPQDIDTNGGVLMLVDVFMPPVRDRVKNRCIKKNAYNSVLAQRRGREPQYKLFGIFARGVKKLFAYKQINP